MVVTDVAGKLITLPYTSRVSSVPSVFRRTRTAPSSVLFPAKGIPRPPPAKVVTGTSDARKRGDATRWSFVSFASMWMYKLFVVVYVLARVQARLSRGYLRWIPSP